MWSLVFVCNARWSNTTKLKWLLLSLAHHGLVAMTCDHVLEKGLLEAVSTGLVYTDKYVFSSVMMGLVGYLGSWKVTSACFFCFFFG